MTRFSGGRLLLTGLLTGMMIVSGNAQGASPRTNYLLYCSGCHLVDGQGNPPNVPTLHHELGRMMAVQEMRSYLLRVPGASHTPLSDSDLAAVVNWVLSEFNEATLPADFQPISAGEVTEARQNILADPLKYRAEHWKVYEPE
jgi:cytochrome c553